MASKSTLELVMFMMITIVFLLISLAPLSFSSSSSYSSSPLAGTNNTKRIGFTAPLFHSIYSPQSPFYNPNHTEFDRLQLSLKSSHSRYKFLLKSRFPGASSFVTDDDEYFDSIEAPVSPFHDALGSQYILRYHIGTPPVQIFAIIDSGSSLTWIQCLPCYYCYNQSASIYDPVKSSTYAALNCDDPDIKNCSPGTGICNTNNNTCSYDCKYIGGDYTRGSLATETLTFDSDVRPPGIIDLNKIAIGCGHHNFFKGAMPLGLVGLDRGKLSILSQIDNAKFSHCFLPMDKRHWKETSTMRFGSAALFLGSTTPMVSNPRSPDFYYLNLEGISVGNERIQYPPGTFNFTQKGNGGLLLDSGSTFTRLNLKAFVPMVDSIKRQIPFKDIGQRYRGFSLCYWCSWYGIARKTPYITFHFTGLDLVLTKEQTWVKVEDGKWWNSYWCLAMKPDTLGRLSIFGNWQMKNMNVGYDLENKVISFKKVDCSRT